ncbi:hypothetical protein MY11210_004081 [Beauveria gryllotalpidicola]
MGHHVTITQSSNHNHEQHLTQTRNIIKFSLVATTMAMAAASGLALPTTDSPDSPAHLARAVLEIEPPSMLTFQKAHPDENPSMCIWAWDKCALRPARLQLLPPAASATTFRYRNTKLQGRFINAMKTRIDDKLNKDLHEYCARFSSGAKGVECRDMADKPVWMEIEVDDDIEGQEIPEIEEHGEDVDDLNAWLGSDEE